MATSTERTARVHWQGDLESGRGSVSATTSGIFSDQPVSWRGRTEPGHDGMTSPEELIAAAHASCFAMTLSGMLAKRGFKANDLNITATVTFGRKEHGWSITTVALDVEGNIPGIDESTFAQLAAQAKNDCPVSRALKGNVDISVEAALAAEQLAAAAGP